MCVFMRLCVCVCVCECVCVLMITCSPKDPQHGTQSFQMLTSF